MILIAYDGTSTSDHAIAVAATLVPRRRAHVVHVWQPLAGAAAEAFATAGVIPPASGDGVDGELQREAERAEGIAQEGVEHARAAGFRADGEAIQGVGSPAQAIEEAIERLDPELVVIGSRGLTGLEALLKGSVSHHVGAHSHAPVLVVPPAQ